ncbi:MAG: hypothetical protein HWQ41_31320 [Nostoc sp. NOS(2021)]|uniref:hypothetical protein n=1 Tax=Nostoc sp. NOS(2021) TaxID=2815407 RepID=UPI0025DB9C80|nr:hypothetical protein [Nostoc sp. NOS(2021)]MBN3899597.1 hypothetical protein [Nostoc sp. NOS(2021)]
MIDLFRDFPCDWDYQGDAHFLLDELTLLVTISLQLRFTDATELNVKIILKDDNRDENGSFANIDIKSSTANKKAIVIQEKVVLMGSSHMPNYYKPVINFRCYKMFIYSGWNSNLPFGEYVSDFVRLKAYLNDDVSSHDEIFGVEFQGLPKKQNKDLNLGEPEYFSPYCSLNSEYELKCGKSYVIHNQDSFRQPNIETFYKLSFIDILRSIKTQNNLSLLTHNIQELEQTMFQCCAFLSILCDYEIIPIYYDFTIYSKCLDKQIQGKLVPIWEKAKISRLSKAWPKQGVALHHNAEAFLECCPLDKQLSNGILELRTTVLDVTSESKLYASCSAIEYFYSYWLRNLGGVQKMEKAFIQNSPLLPSDKKFNYSLIDAKKANGRTPALSLTIRFFLDKLGIDWNKYIKKSKGTPDFLNIRNNLLHGKYTDGDLPVIYASQVAEKIAIEVMLYILKKISKSNIDFYTNIPIEEPINHHTILSDGWSEIVQALDMFINGEQDEVFWSLRTRELWQEIWNSEK